MEQSEYLQQILIVLESIDDKLDRLLEPPTIAKQYAPPDLSKLVTIEPIIHGDTKQWKYDPGPTCEHSGVAIDKLSPDTIKAWLGPDVE